MAGVGGLNGAVSGSKGPRQNRRWEQDAGTELLAGAGGLVGAEREEEAALRGRGREEGEADRCGRRCAVTRRRGRTGGMT